MSFDGTRQKRGPSSHNGVASVTDLVTGFFQLILRYYLIIAINVKLLRGYKMMLSGKQSIL